VFVHVITGTVFQKSICINSYEFTLPNLSQEDVLRDVLWDSCEIPLDELDLPRPLLAGLASSWKCKLWFSRKAAHCSHCPHQPLDP